MAFILKSGLQSTVPLLLPNQSIPKEKETTELYLDHLFEENAELKKENADLREDAKKREVKTEELNSMKYAGTRPNEKCPCHSKKRYKNCHGKKF
jgi:hypothetical protein